MFLLPLLLRVDIKVAAIVMGKPLLLHTSKRHCSSRNVAGACALFLGGRAEDEMRDACNMSDEHIPMYTQRCFYKASLPFVCCALLSAIDWTKTLLFF